MNTLYAVVEHQAIPNSGNVQYMMDVCGAIIPAFNTLLHRETSGLMATNEMF